MKVLHSLLCLMLSLSLIGCSGSQPAGDSPAAVSNLRLPAVFSDHMVLQQGRSCPVWGWATDGTRVTVEIGGQSLHTVAKNGRWQVRLDPLTAGDSYTLTVRTRDRTVDVKDVLAGEVWVCSGQSNMEWPLESADHAQTEIMQADLPAVRLFTVEKATDDQPQDDVTGTWLVCSPRTVPDFSAVGYLFGKNLYDHGIRPLGLIDTTWGGTPAEAWTSYPTLRSDPAFAPILARDVDTDTIKAQLARTYGADLLTDERNPDVVFSDQSALQQGWADPDTDMTEWKTMDLPVLWESAGLNLDGVVWFRREVVLPETWAGRDLVLRLSAIDDYDLTYFNGTQVGRTYSDTPSAWLKPRVYTVPGNLVKAGRNTVAVRVLDMQGGGGIYQAASPMDVAPAGAKTPISLTGPWHYRIEKIMALGSGEQNMPARLFNAMVAPLVPYTIKGVVWYQGESNADRAYQYRKLFPAMIEDWRRAWGGNDFPFYFVQLANYMQRKPNPGDSAWAELREAQQMALSLPNTGMAVIIDAGDANDIHPRDKQTVGRRLALIARARDYGEPVEYSGPVYKSMTIEDNRIRLRFDHVDTGLRADGALRGFAIAGADKNFVWAHAVIEDHTVVVSSDAVAQPVAVRYAWADNPDCNLYNGAGLPASPFRTDDWPGMTIDNK